ncbi:MAG: hypothetical protein E7560_04965 [Ruminococcaceae bacterium]|nr:hypothetical protein [Oscillospiraceae bacterium]
MTNNDFLNQQRTHIEHMKEMNARANAKRPNQPHAQACKQNNAQNPLKAENKEKTATLENKSTHNKGLGSSFLEQLNIDGDTALIIGLLLLLISDSNDKMLLFALIYILT